MISGSNIGIHGGAFHNTVINQTHRTSRGIDILMEWVATDAFHNSRELYDAPKCHPHTRVAVLDDIMHWVNESESAQEDFMMWLFGPAGAGKSAIAKRIAEIAAETDLLIADFFFSRTSSTRNSTDRLIATLAYQMTLSIPDTRSYIEDAIERDRAIFNKNIPTQINTLLIKPFQSISSMQVVISQKLIIIDGLDECNDRQAQVAIVDAISRCLTQHKLPIIFLVVSRPEPDLVTSFNCSEPLRDTHRRLSLDDSYQPSDDIRLFLSDKFKSIKSTHCLKSTIPGSWPSQETLDTLVEKSSGQFIYASTVVKFVESSCHRPTARLNIILGTSPPGRTIPFAELDALYHHILSSVDDIQLTLHVLSLFVMAPLFVSIVLGSHMPPELFLSLEPGDIQLALINLSSIVTYHESSGKVEILHASLVDFLSDERRSTIFYIDMASIQTDFVYRILQYVKGPDGIRAGDIGLFHGLMFLSLPILKGQLLNDILNFDLGAFINASTRLLYNSERPFTRASRYTIKAIWIWKNCLTDLPLEDRVKNEALDRLHKYLEPPLQIYQSDWRLHLLLTFEFADVEYFGSYRIPRCRRPDILLEMDDHDLHLADQNALNLRHQYLEKPYSNIIPCVDNDAYASAALHCMRFLFNPPKYFDKNECPEMGLIHIEWKATCDMTLNRILPRLLQLANASPELVQFISNHDIHPRVQNTFPADDLWEVDIQILVFLSRVSVCPNWRILSAIQRHKSLIQTTRSSSDDDEVWSSDLGLKELKPHEKEKRKAAHHLIRQRLDQCCSNTPHWELSEI